MVVITLKLKHHLSCSAPLTTIFAMPVKASTEDPYTDQGQVVQN